MTAYPDRGGWAVGWGHHQDKPSTISLEEAERLFEEDYARARGYALKAAPEAPEEVLDILTNMAYNLGGSGLLSFKRMLGNIKEKCYAKAAKEMVESDWYHQVGSRSVRLVKRMYSIRSDKDGC